MPTIAQDKKKQNYINKARETEERYNIPPNTLVGLLAQESGHFNEDVISGKKKSYAGAVGVAQFMPKTAKQFKIDPLNTDQAIDAAGKYLSSSYKTFGNWDDAILSYNAGVGRVKEYKNGKPIKIKEHSEYVGRVKSQIQRYGGNNVPKGIPQQLITTNLPNFENNVNIPTFAGVPDTEQKVTEDKDVKELEQKTSEYNFLQELQNLPSRELAQEQQELRQQKVQPQSANYLQQYEQVGQFLDSDIVAQQGGKFSQNELDFLSDIAIKDNNGYWNPKNQGKVVEIEGSSISMKNVNQPLIGIADTGEQKIMKPEQEYKFLGATKVVEIPFFKK